MDQSERGTWPIRVSYHRRDTSTGRKTSPATPLWSYFQRGAVYAFPRRPQVNGGGSVTYEVHGAIWEKYRALGEERSFLGYPRTNETDAVQTDVVRGRYNDFQGGSIYWHPNYGAHEVHGAIRDKWLSLGGVNNVGFPLTDELPAPRGGRYNDFEGRPNPIYWHPNYGAHWISDPVVEKWTTMGGINSQMGYPTGDLYATLSYWRQDFEGGYIVFGDNPNDFFHTTSYCHTSGPGCDRVISGGGGQSQETVTIALVRQPIFQGSIPYVSTFPTLGSINGNLIRLANPNPNIVLRFPKLGHSTADCNIPADVISLDPSAATSTQNLLEIFGSGSPSLPVTLVACIATAGPVPDSVLLSVTYSYTP